MKRFLKKIIVIPTLILTIFGSVVFFSCKTKVGRLYTADLVCKVLKTTGLLDIQLLGWNGYNYFEKIIIKKSDRFEIILDKILIDLSNGLIKNKFKITIQTAKINSNSNDKISLNSLTKLKKIGILVNYIKCFKIKDSLQINTQNDSYIFQKMLFCENNKVIEVNARFIYKSNEFAFNGVFDTDFNKINLNVSNLNEYKCELVIFKNIDSEFQIYGKLTKYNKNILDLNLKYIYNNNNINILNLSGILNNDPFSLHGCIHIFDNRIVASINSLESVFDLNKFMLNKYKKIQACFEYEFLNSNKLIAYIKGDNENICNVDISIRDFIEINLDKIRPKFYIKKEQFAFNLDFVSLKLSKDFTKIFLNMKSGGLVLKSSLHKNTTWLIDDLLLNSAKLSVNKKNNKKINDVYFNQIFEVNVKDLTCINDLFCNFAAKLTGKCKAELGIADSGIYLVFKTDKGICYGNIEVFNTNFFGNLNDFKLDISKLKIANLNFNDIRASIVKDTFKITSLKGKNIKDLEINGTFKNTSEEFTLNINDLIFSKYGIKLTSSNLLINYSFDKNRLNIMSDLIKINNSGNLKINSEISDNYLVLDSDFKNLALQSFLASKRLYNLNVLVDTFINGRLNIKGKLDNLYGKFDININKNSNKILELLVESNKNDDGLTIGNLRYKFGIDSIVADFKLPMILNLIEKKFTNSHSNQIGVDMHISGNFQNMLLIPDSINIRGNCFANISISGNKLNPNIKANLKIKNGLYEQAGVIFPNINADIIANDIDKLKINKLEAKDSKGHIFQITGYGNLIFDKNVPDIDCHLYVNANNYNLINSENLNMSISGKATGTGLLSHLKIFGNLDVNAIYNTDSIFEEKDFSGLIIHDPQKRSKTLIYEKENYNGNSLFDFNLNLNCHNLKVTGSSMDSNFSGKLKFLTFDNELALDGLLKLKDGTLNFLTKKMRIRNGELLFKPKNKFVPLVTMTATETFRDFMLLIKIASNDNLGLTVDILSNPRYQLEQLLSRIIFGRPVQELKIAEAVKIQEAIKNVKHNDNNSLKFLEQISKLMSVSLSVEQNKLNTDQETYSLNAGTYITDKIYIGVKKDFEKDTTSGNVKINISPQFFVEGDTNGDFGITWFRRY